MPAVPGQTRTGNLISVELGGVKVGLLASARVSNNYGLDPQSGIGDVHVVEYVVTRAQHTVTASKGMLLGKSFEKEMSQTHFPSNGDEALAADLFDVVAFGKDPKNPTAQTAELWRALFCRLDTAEVDVQAHRTLVQNATFMALDVKGLWG